MSDNPVRNLRIYGTSPFKFAVIHGGPGASREMAPVARELYSSKDIPGGILEPLQTVNSLEGQILELKSILEKHGSVPLILIGFSWGAMLSFIFAARYPQLVEKLILIGSGPYEEKYSEGIMDIRISRFGKEDLKNYLHLSELLNSPSDKVSVMNKNSVFCSIGKLISKVDAYDPLPYEEELLECDYEIFKNVWQEARELRKIGRLLELAKEIQCPVVAIHGNYDPHPYAGVKEPLSQVLINFKFILLQKCGHKPWIERAAKEEFYRILMQEIKQLK